MPDNTSKEKSGKIGVPGAMAVGIGGMVGGGIFAVLGEAVANPGDRPHYIRGILDWGTAQFFASGMQQSHALNGLARADALLRLGAGESLQEGAEVAVFPVA